MTDGLWSQQSGEGCIADIRRLVESPAARHPAASSKQLGRRRLLPSRRLPLAFIVPLGMRQHLVFVLTTTQLLRELREADLHEDDFRAGKLAFGLVELANRHGRCQVSTLFVARNDDMDGVTLYEHHVPRCKMLDRVFRAFLRELEDAVPASRQREPLSSLLRPYPRLEMGGVPMRITLDDCHQHHLESLLWPKQETHTPQQS